MKNIVLITGGAGFIGSHLVDFINEVSPRTKVRVLDDFSSGTEANLQNVRADVFEGSILDDEILTCALKDTSAVIHLAALGGVERSIADPAKSHEVNVTGTLRVLEASRRNGITQVVYASSSSVYGSNPKLPRAEDDWTSPMSPYAASKLAAESYVSAVSQVYPLRTISYRFFNVYGPRQRSDHDYAAVIPRFIRNALDGQPLLIEGDGTQTRDFTYVKSVVRVLWESVVRGLADCRPVNLAFGKRTSILQLSKMLGEVMSTELEIEFVRSRRGDVQASQADTKKLFALFPVLLEVDFRTGLEETLEWHRTL